MKKNKKLFAILTLVAFMMTLMPVMAFAAGLGIVSVELDADKKSVVYTFDTFISDNSTANASDFTAVTTTNAAITVTGVEYPNGTIKRATGGLNQNQIRVHFSVPIANNEGVKVTYAPANAGQFISNLDGTVKMERGTETAKAPVTPTTPQPAKPAASIIATKSKNVSIESDGGAASAFPTKDTKYATVKVALYAGNNVTGNTSGLLQVYVWAEEKAGFATDALVLADEDGNKFAETIAGSGVYVVSASEFVNNIATLRAAFIRANANGYELNASFEDPTGEDSVGNPKAEAKLKEVTLLKQETDKSLIKVTAPAQETRDWTIDVEQGDVEIVTGLEDGQTTTDFVEVAADTVATSEVKLTVKNQKGDLVRNYPIKLSTNSANIELDEEAITTEYDGTATFNVAGLREGEYKIYVAIGDYESTIKVQVGATSANNIQLIKFPSNPIATDTDVDDYKDIFRFQLTDANGNIVKGDEPKGAYFASISNKAEATATGKTTSEMAKYAAVISAPEANKVKNADLKLKYVANKDYYTLDIDSGKAFEAEGDYEIRVVLDNGKSATLNFTVKKFDKAVSLHIEYPTEAVELNSETDVPDIYFLDANNVMKKANNRVLVAASGYAVADIVESGDNAGVLTVKNDEKYVGQTITVTAVSDKENLTASTTLTVADEAREVKLDTTRGQVNANNRVGFKVVDSTGRAVALGRDSIVEVTAVVTNTGDADAKVSYSIPSSSRTDLMERGTGVINLSSNKETNATVQIMVKVTKKNSSINSGKQDNNTGLSTTYYTGTETFTFGAEADKSVVMTIGSREIVANNVPATIDVAPFIKDNRTFVPFRALVEAFGAEVNYDEATSTVTTKLDGKTVVLTVGSTVLTVNDETVTMDVAPYIVNDRVVVPVRFVGEAFGFTVEATQDAETGATASVVFYQK